MVNDAAQYFARYIHDKWSKSLAQERNAGESSTSIVLIFISTLDRICYISSGNRIAAVLPWWRLEHVVQDMKPYLQNGQIGDALFKGIEDLSKLLITGPPSFADRVNDFLERFGVVILFTIFTFVFATWGECRDRRKRLFLAERRSRMTAAEKERARLLQVEFRSQICPICLEPFDLTPEKDTRAECDITSHDSSQKRKNQKLKRVDSFGIPIIGSDDKPIKMLRCGHIFDSTCWQMWVDSGTGNPWICPVCRQDVGRPKRREESTNQDQQQSSLFARMMTNTSGPSMLLRPINNTPHYNSIQHSPITPIRFVNRLGVHPTLGLSSTALMDGVTENTPLFSRASTGEGSDDH
ncbi:hypothetical protein ACHAW5_006329 [Stephanodiscus triporus]|uniref:RING-type domain-containing protein n=1 Tax=Stephanodiscus triporus TaxID=2934178 RepID=A0ABD3PTZ5_9STRA